MIGTEIESNHYVEGSGNFRRSGTSWRRVDGCGDRMMEWFQSFAQTFVVIRCNEKLWTG